MSPPLARCAIYRLTKRCPSSAPSRTRPTPSRRCSLASKCQRDGIVYHDNRSGGGGTKHRYSGERAVGKAGEQEGQSSTVTAISSGPHATIFPALHIGALCTEIQHGAMQCKWNTVSGKVRVRYRGLSTRRPRNHPGSPIPSLSDLQSRTHRQEGAPASRQAQRDPGPNRRNAA